LIEVPRNKALRNTFKLNTTQQLAEWLKSLKNTHNSTDLIKRSRIERAIEIALFEKENLNLIHHFPKFKSQLFGIYFTRDALKKRITERLKKRLENEGMIDEVQHLISNGIKPEKLKFYGLEYKFITQYLLNEISKKEMFEKLNIAIHQFSKRQATWFRRMEKNGFHIHWMDGNLPLDEKIKLVLKQ